MKSRTLFRVLTRNRQLHYWYFAIFYLLNKLHIHVFHYYLLLMLLHKTLLAIISRASTCRRSLRCVNPIITCEKTVHAVCIWMLNNRRWLSLYFNQIVDIQAHSINEFWPALISIEYRWVVTTLIHTRVKSRNNFLIMITFLNGHGIDWIGEWWLTLIMWQFSIQSIQNLLSVVPRSQKLHQIRLKYKRIDFQITSHNKKHRKLCQNCLPKWLLHINHHSS